jgi:recombination protein RecA
VMYREAEQAFNPQYAAALGMPMDNVDFGDNPLDTVEDLFEDLERVVKRKSKHPVLYFCDSLDALSDRAEMERDMDKGSYGAEKAKKLSQMFRRTVRDLGRSNVTVGIVSQVRDKIGAMFGRKTTRSGGRALDFYASQVVYLAHIGIVNKTVSNIKRATGVKIKAMVDKNKVSLAYRDAEFQIQFGYGVNDALACLEWLKQVGSLKESGVKPDEIKTRARQMDAAELAQVHAIVEARWFELEKSFIPDRKKYE